MPRLFYISGRQDREMTKDEDRLREYENYLYEKERQPNTIKKYLRDVRKFLAYAREREGEWEGGGGEKELMIRYKTFLMENYQTASVNTMLIAVNGYLNFIGRRESCVKLCRVQRKIFIEEDRELSREEYQRLVVAAEKNGSQRLSCILQTIGSTGIRISELKYITAEALEKKMVNIRLKGKERWIILPNSLISLLKEYCREQGIEHGYIFVTRSGKPVDRRNVWAEMKKLCAGAGVAESKVFPHNLRHLFARAYYEKEKDIIRLADYLGHSSVDTTRRYTMISGAEACRRQLELGMLVSVPGRRGKTCPGTRSKKERNCAWPVKTEWGRSAWKEASKAEGRDREISNLVRHLMMNVPGEEGDGRTGDKKT